MSKLRLLITGDDGYQSLGTRLLVKLLKDEYDITVAGTVVQQSAVGGKISLQSGFNWGKTEVEGVSAFWVEGTPVDAMELMACYEQPAFDVVLSGINWGANLGGAIFSSGTVNAAVGAIVRGSVPKGIALSWDLPPEFYTMHHDKAHSLDEYLEYPGKAAQSLIKHAISAQLWGAQFLNVNFPYKPTTEVRVTRLLEDVRSIYDYSTKVTGDQDHFSFEGADRVFKKDIDPVYDVRALTDGFISLTPCQVDLVNLNLFHELQSTNLSLNQK